MIGDECSFYGRHNFERGRCTGCGRRVTRSNDRIPRCERLLAEKLRDIHLLWEPGFAREEMIAIAVDDCSEVV